MAHGDRNDAPQVGMQVKELDESPFRDPVDRELRPVGTDVGDDGERMDDIAQRRGTHDENRGSGCLAGAAGRRDRGLAQGSLRRLSRAHAAFAVDRCRQDSGETS